jgi:hypothetical protein
MVVFLCVCFLCLAQVPAKADVVQRAEYTMAINDIIVKCSKKQCLKNSRSFQLRCCAEKAAGKADFLRRNQDRLVEEMMAEKLPLKAYKVERFVNARYSNAMHSKR